MASIPSGTTGRDWPRTLRCSWEGAGTAPVRKRGAYLRVMG